MMKKIIIIGASGVIGSAVLSCAIKKGLDVLPTYYKNKIEGGVKFSICHDDVDSLNVNFGDVIIFLSAYSEQNWISENKLSAHIVNVEATQSLIERLMQRGADIIFISSEAVFGLDAVGGWDDASSVCPMTEYGRQKAEVESFLAQYKNVCIIRTGWNVASYEFNRCVVANTYKDLLQGTARIAVDNIFTLTDVNDTANAIIEIAINRIYGILHVVGNTPIKRLDLAEKIIESSKFKNIMKFTRVKFSELNLKEQKSGSSWIQASNKLGGLIHAFKEPHKIVEEKTRILDQMNSRFI